MPPAAGPAAPAAPIAPAGFWRDVRDAIVGVRQDYTQGSIGRAVLLLGIPMVLEMSMQSVFAVVDVFFVGKLGSAAVAIVGLSDSLLMLVFSVAVGLSMGTTAMVARRIGEGSPKEAGTAASQAILLGLLLSLPVAILGIFYSKELLLLMGASGGLATEGSLFTAILLGGNATVMLLFLINAVFRGAGDPALAMRSLWIANLINIVLDPILIFGWGPIPAFGLEGAAVATTLGRGLGVLYQWRQLSNRKGRIVVRLPDLRLQTAIMARLFRVSGIGMLQYLVSTASFLGLVRILAVFGESVLAGYTVSVRIIMFVLLPAWGMGNAAATLVGQNLGAGNPDRAERSVWTTARWNTVFLAIVAVVFVTFSRQLVSIFTQDEIVIGVAADCLRIFSYSYVFWGFGVITILAFNGAGDTTTPTWLNFWVFWVFQIPLAWTLGRTLGMGHSGVFWAITASQLLLAISGVILFRRGSWKTRTI